MSTQAKSKLYLLIIGILLITNIGMLFFLLKDKPGNPKPPRDDRRKMMRNFLQKEIGFDTVQIQQYDTLSKLFKDKNKIEMDSLRSNKEEQIKVLGSKGFSEATIDSMVNKSAENQKIMELHLLNHFATIRKLCTPQQVTKFDTSFYKLWSKKKKPDEKK